MPSESQDDEEMSVAEDIQWDETMEMALCYAAIKFKPVGKLRDCFPEASNLTGSGVCSPMDKDCVKEGHASVL